MSPGHFQSVRQCDALALQELSLFDIQGMHRHAGCSDTGTIFPIYPGSRERY